MALVGRYTGQPLYSPAYPTADKAIPWHLFWDLHKAATSQVLMERLERIHAIKHGLWIGPMGGGEGAAPSYRLLDEWHREVYPHS